MTQLQHVPLSLLHLSRSNIRRTGGTDVAALAASIHADGLLQNLTVARIPPDTDQPADHYAVIAGGRRLRALQLLRDRGDLDPEHQVPVNIVDDAIATEIGLAENTVREAMHPHDEFVAIRDMHAAGIGTETIAARFGVEPIVVTRRLRLANVAPELLRLFREDKLTLDQMQAFALTEDHTAQLRVFQAAQGSAWELKPASIRAALTPREIPTTDARARFVGVDTYLAADGAMRRDLFATTPDAGYLLDQPLLDKLVDARLQAEADALRAKGWSFVHIVPYGEESWKFKQNCERSEPKRVTRTLTPEQTRRAAEVDARMKELDQVMDGDDEREYDNDELDNFETERLDLYEERKLLSPDGYEFTDGQRAKSGAVISVGYNGALEVECGLIPREGSKAETAANKPVADATGTTPAPKTPTLAESMVRRLSAHRTIALQAEFTANSDVALATIAHALLAPLLYDGFVISPLSITVRNEMRSVRQLNLDDVDDAAAGLQLAIDTTLSNFGVPKQPAELYPWLLCQNCDTICCLLRIAVAQTCTAITGNPTAKPAADLAEALNLDMAAHWRPTAATFTGIVPKALVLQAITEVHGAAQAARCAGMKRDELAGEAERLLATTGWLPKPLRRPGYKTSTPTTNATKTAVQRANDDAFAKYQAAERSKHGDAATTNSPKPKAKAKPKPTAKPKAKPTAKAKPKAKPATKKPAAKKSKAA